MFSPSTVRAPSQRRPPPAASKPRVRVSPNRRLRSVRIARIVSFPALPGYQSRWEWSGKRGNRAPSQRLLPPAASNARVPGRASRRWSRLRMWGESHGWGASSYWECSGVCLTQLADICRSTFCFSFPSTAGIWTIPKTAHKSKASQRRDTTTYACRRA